MRKASRKKWSFESLEGRTLLAAPTLIDVMVVYDANAKTQLNVNDAAIQKLIRQSIDSANQAHFLVAYHDNRGILASTLDDNDILVVGPPGSTQSAHFVSSTVSPGGSFTYATYSITPPGGTWGWRDDGNYNLILQPNQVTDAKGNAAGLTGQNNLIGSIIVHIPFPGDADGDNATSFSDLVAVAQNYGTAGKGQASGDFDYDGLVGFSDLVMVAQNYGRNLSDSLPSSPVPAMPVVVAPSKPAPVTKPQPVSKPIPAFSTTPIKSKNKDLFNQA